MTFRSRSVLLLILFVVGTGAAPAAASVDSDSDSDKGARKGEKDAGKPADKLYKQGRKALDDERWKEAAAAFAEVIRLKGARSDAAAYWLAYAFNKDGRKAEALAILRSFRGQYPQSSWIK
ncbi:MAG TPA: outer membrane protein assembly factor BamD, partial [Thermoanaerobaculia bacterium]